MGILPFFTKLFLRYTRLSVFSPVRECSLSPESVPTGQSLASPQHRPLKLCSAPPLSLWQIMMVPVGLISGAPPLGNPDFPFTVLTKPRMKDTEIKTAMCAQVS